jgi:two-component system, sensor histidine kinase YesM
MRLRIQWSLFTKMLTFLAMLLIVIAVLYGYTVTTTTNSVKQELQASHLKQLEFLLSQIENNIDQLALNAYNLLHDPSLRDYANLPSIAHLLEQNELRVTIMEKLALQSTASAWSNSITIYFPATGDVLSSDPQRSSSSLDALSPLSPNWNYTPTGAGNSHSGEFVLRIADTEQSSALMLEAAFPAENIRNMLDAFKQYGDPFLYQPSGRLITNYDADSVTIHEITRQFSSITLGDKLSTVTELNGQSFLLNAVSSASTGWYLIDFIPLENVLHPIRESTTLFAWATAALLALGIGFAFLLYRNVMRPIRKLVSSLSRFKEGDYGVRIGVIPALEFRILTEGFNEMAKRVGDLIDKVLAEQLRAKEAEFKQLQSQINPHFLYNCLFFIKSKAKVGDTESVEAMALSLGEYYRYMTRSESGMVPIQGELDLLENYLAIQNLRKQRIRYVIQIPEPMARMQIPRLLLQPLVENAVVHGIEPKPGLGTIRISGQLLNNGFSLVISDDGIGMPEEKLKQLTDALSRPIEAGVGYGVWNVRQRMIQQYGPGSSLTITSEQGSGTTITLICMNQE